MCSELEMYQLRAPLPLQKCLQRAAASATDLDRDLQRLRKRSRDGDPVLGKRTRRSVSSRP